MSDKAMNRSSLVTDASKAYREFVSKMYGIAPNRILMNSGNAEMFKDELMLMFYYEMSGVQKILFQGMRLVVDDNAVGIEVAYAR